MNRNNLSDDYNRQVYIDELYHIITNHYTPNISHVYKAIDLLIQYLIYDTKYNHHANKVYIIKICLNRFLFFIDYSQRTLIIQSYARYIEEQLNIHSKLKKEKQNRKSNICNNCIIL